MYKPALSIFETEKAIKTIKDHFESSLSDILNLMRVSAPMLLKSGNGFNDDLNGIERKVTFQAKDIPASLDIVQSLAKWKRAVLSRYGLSVGEGIYADMKAIRRDEALDNLHSLYVEQWDWERILSKRQKNLDTLKYHVKVIYHAIKETEYHLYKLYPELVPVLPEEISFITTQELEDRYPDLTPKEREDRIAKKYGAVFIMQIGGRLCSGKEHDTRAPDYDDWSLNGDILFWYPVLEKAIEISSMGIRVDEQALQKQLVLSKQEDRKALEYHQSILKGQLPLTIGGGIGQSRLFLFFLKKAHIGEVQASVWNEQMIAECRKANIPLL
ncbi:aspartate--ammonia ligase [Bacillus tuaregi]|uniref:aspartate--ammonia ligase n=1 Tax=Bacillus tuaregi TaxID=1816695 RepID=UPI001C9BDB3F|nr:aspartate--ammonia ligase [Bacillus tuaregi]